VEQPASSRFLPYLKGVKKKKKTLLITLHLHRDRIGGEGGDLSLSSVFRHINNFLPLTYKGGEKEGGVSVFFSPFFYKRRGGGKRVLIKKRRGRG